MLRAKQARHRYQADSQTNACENVVIRSVDMQKMLMLPRLPGNKTAIFQKHIVAYHQTFATVGTNKTKKNTVSVV